MLSGSSTNRFLQPVGSSGSHGSSVEFAMGIAFEVGVGILEGLTAGRLVGGTVVANCLAASTGILVAVGDGMGTGVGFDVGCGVGTDPGVTVRPPWAVASTAADTVAGISGVAVGTEV
ncbi:hypothetical protein M1O29_01190 [Dehalococcoidia bacterium]|nr:hypothetical protein [Dehalococcoidia bacterium]